MKVADLFVELGVKGDGSAQKAMNNVQGGLTKISTAGLEAKAALIAMMYGLQRLSASSAAEGTSISNLTTLLDISGKEFQQWSYVAQKSVGAGAGEMEASLKGIQSAMTNMIMSGKAPLGWGWMKKAGIDLDSIDVRKPLEVMKKVNEFVQLNKDKPDILRKVFSEFGISDNIGVGMLKNAFTPKNLGSAKYYTEGQTTQLDNVRKKWFTLEDDIKRGIGKLNAEHGGQLVGDIQKLIPKIFEIITAFDKLAIKLKVFERIGTVFDGIASALGVVSSTIDKINGKEMTGIFGPSKPGKDGKVNDESGPGLFNPAVSSFFENLGNSFKGFLWEHFPVPGAAIPAGGNTTNNTVNIHSTGENGKQIAKHVEGVLNSNKIKNSAGRKPSRSQSN